MEVAVIMGPEPRVPTEHVLQTQRAQAAALAAALAGRGHDVLMFACEGALDDAARRRVLGAGVRVQTSPGSSTPAFSQFLARHWESHPPSVIYASGTESGMSALAAAGERSVALVQDARGAAPPDDPRLYDRAHRVLAISVDHSDLLVRAGIAHHKLTVIPYGMTTEGLAPVEELRTGRSGRTLLCPDGPAQNQGAADIVAALPWLPDATLTIAGGPDPEASATDPDVRRIRALAARIGVDDRVALTGRLPAEDVCAAYGAADVVVTVPHRPNAGITCLNAMACGSCVVATAMGGAKDAVLHGITGFLVPPRDPRALARALRQLLLQPTLITSFGFAAADRARMRYGWEQLAQESERVFAEALQGAGFWPDAPSVRAPVASGTRDLIA